MLDDLRKKQKTIIWAIAIVFVLGMALMGIQASVMEFFFPRNVVGKIYGKKIKYAEYDYLVRQNIDNYRYSNPDEILDDEKLQNINDQTWNQLVQQRVVEKQLRKNKIKVNDNEIINKIKHDPPQWVLQEPNLQTNGNFDFQKYYYFIANLPEFADQLEQYVRSTLPSEKLEQKIKDKVIATEDSVRLDWIEKNDKASGIAIYFDWNRVASDEGVSDEEINDYYNNNNKKYKKEPLRKLNYIIMPVKPSNEDSLSAKDEIDYIYELYQQNGDFASLATQFSQDQGSATQGGSLGFFGKGMMVPAFEQTAFSLKVGETSEPFLSDFGWHFLTVTNTRKGENGEPEVEASHILIKIEASETTKMNIRNNAEYIYDEAKRTNLNTIATEQGFEVMETGEIFADNEFISGIGRFPNLVKETFKNKIGYVAQPFRTQDGSYVIAEISLKQPATIQPLNEVFSVIRREIDKDKKMIKAKEMALDITNNNDSIEYVKLAEENGFRTSNFADILITRSIPSIGLVKPFNKAIFNTEAGQWTELIETENGLYIALVTKRDIAPLAYFDDNIEQLTENYRRQKEQTVFSEWYQNVIKEANAIDLRYMFY